MTDAQEVLLQYIKENNALPSIEKCIDMYVENSLRTDNRCIFTRSKTVSIDYKYWEMKEKAGGWLRSSTGSLVLQCKIHLCYEWDTLPELISIQES